MTILILLTDFNGEYSFNDLTISISLLVKSDKMIIIRNKESRKSDSSNDLIIFMTDIRA